MKYKLVIKETIEEAINTNNTLEYVEINELNWIAKADEEYYIIQIYNLGLIGDSNSLYEVVFYLVDKEKIDNSYTDLADSLPLEEVANIIAPKMNIKGMNFMEKVSTIKQQNSGTDKTTTFKLFNTVFKMIFEKLSNRKQSVIMFRADINEPTRVSIYNLLYKQINKINWLEQLCILNPNDLSSYESNVEILSEIGLNRNVVDKMYKDNTDKTIYLCEVV